MFLNKSSSKNKLNTGAGYADTLLIKQTLKSSGF